MPLFNAVKPLKTLSSECLCDCLGVAVQVGNNFAQFSCYSSVILPANLRQDILNLFICRHGGRTPVLFKGLEILLDASIRELILDKCSTCLWFEDCLRLYLLLEKCDVIRLEKLKLCAGKLISVDLSRLTDLNSPLHRLLSQLVCLRSLTVEFVADNDVLLLVGQHCPQLQHLDVSYSWAVTDEGVYNLCHHTSKCISSLYSVILQETSVSVDGLVILLKCLPYLKHLGAFPHSRTISCAIQRLYLENPGVSLQLRHVWDSSITPKDISVIQACCPCLISLHSNIFAIVQMPHLPNLSDLTITFNFQDVKGSLDPVLQRQGFHLKKLTIINQKYALDTNVLFQFCPGIIEFSGKIIGLVPPVCQPVMTLKVANIVPDSCDSTSHFVKNVPNIEKLHIGQNITFPINPSTIDSIFKESDFNLLEEFEIKCKNSLDIKCILTILTSCPLLRKIGQLKHWKGIQDSDLFYLKRLIKLKNWNLTLT